MGRMIVKQTNGKYAVFSSICDNLILVGATPEQIIEFYIKDAVEDITESVHDQINSKRMLDLDMCLKAIYGKEGKAEAKVLLLSDAYLET